MAPKYFLSLDYRLGRPTIPAGSSGRLTGPKAGIRARIPQLASATLQRVRLGPVLCAILLGLDFM